MSAPVRVMIVDDHVVVRRGLAAFLADVPDVEVVLEAPDGLVALERLAALERPGTPGGEHLVTPERPRELPDVVLVDLQMPRLDGLGTVRLLAERYPGLRVVILSGYGEPERIHAALEAGAAGYLLKDAEPHEVVTAVRVAASGGVHLGPMVARRLTRRLTSPTSGVCRLTPRERDILALVASGCSNRQIADRLRITERTARTHVSNVLAKLHLSSRTQAALVAIREGLVPAPGPADQPCGRAGRAVPVFRASDEPASR